MHNDVSVFVAKLQSAWSFHLQVEIQIYSHVHVSKQHANLQHTLPVRSQMAHSHSGKTAA